MSTIRATATSLQRLPPWAMECPQAPRRHIRESRRDIQPTRTGIAVKGVPLPSNTSGIGNRRTGLRGNRLPASDGGELGFIVGVE